MKILSSIWMLIFEGDVKFGWDQYYYEAERHMEALHAVSHNIAHAIWSWVKTVRIALK
ncbi:hypothetical protein ACIGCH_17710 [Pseudomonas helleri]|uniref:hypothetical protein n=1 Tax=Pseudomonas TaxID=286 RepID=UPI0014745B00|nr:hypothetical protein [Pseudomonas fragi]NNA85474.1 hypothetical protein [Pseudomonas fragi]NNB38674.1 hypothetical protein [Pseudomonas fragi]